MKKKVYWIRIEQLEEVYKCMSQDDASTICQEHYKLVELLPLFSLSSKKPIIYWIENTECKMTNHLNEIPDFEYIHLTLTDFIKIKSNENRLQKQKTDVVRGDDTEGNRVQSRKCKASVTIGHLSYQAVKG